MADKNGDFWDLSDMLPERRKRVVSGHNRDVETVAIDLEMSLTKRHAAGTLSFRFHEVGQDYTKSSVPSARTSTAFVREHSAGQPDKVRQVVVSRNSDKTEKWGDTELKLPQRRTAVAAEKIDEYSPDTGLLRRVRIMRWPSKYSFYEQFRFDAKRYMNEPGADAPEVDFFSYTPQYRQMSKQQLEFYFRWRRCAVNGDFIPASFSYVLLYIYEIINLGELLPPEEGLRRLCSVWLAYREKNRVLDKYLSEWLADYCLINRLPCPRNVLAPIMPAIMENASFREFYMDGGEEGVSANTLIDMTSDYHWQKSKFASETAYSSLYASVIPSAVGYVIHKSGDDRFSSQSMKSAFISRDAFCGSLCAQNVKCRIDIEYLSYVRSHTQRALVTELVKYAENRLRAYLGIRPRLRVTELDARLRELMDEYFDREYPPAKKKQTVGRQAPRADDSEYNSSYEALSFGINADDAAKIELESWASTELLAPEDIDSEQESAAPLVKKEEAEDRNEGLLCRLDDTLRGYLAAVLSGTGSEYCREHGIYEDEAASRVNEAASDIIGDILVEPNGAGGYSVIEDYIDEIK